MDLAYLDVDQKMEYWVFLVQICSINIATFIHQMEDGGTK